jgi:predicted esterase
MRQKKCLWRVALGIAAVLMFGLTVTVSGLETSYNLVHEIMDWGPATTKLVVDLGETVHNAAFDIDTFTVFVEKYDSRVTENPKIGEGFRKVTAIYTSDEQGTRADAGQYITLEVAYGFDDSLSSPMNYYNGFNEWIDCRYTITQQKGIGGVAGLVADSLQKTFRPQVDKFNLGGKITYNDSEFGSITLTYADYKPGGFRKGGDRPLIIWLHGGGEGGTDTTLPISANKATEFASGEVQRIFGGAAYVLVPQAPTMWMDTGREDPRDVGDDTTNKSKFTRAVKNLIDFYVESNPGIDKNRIYVGGCSNGGFLTQILIMDYPDYFAAAFPICSAALDSMVLDEQLESIKDMPIWYVNAAADTTVVAIKNSLATYDRLVKLGAPHVYFSYPRDVRDVTGRYFTAEGSAVVYPGHWSWIYVYNNALSQEINGVKISILEWLSAQRKK